MDIGLRDPRKASEEIGGGADLPPKGQDRQRQLAVSVPANSRGGQQTEADNEIEFAIVAASHKIKEIFIKGGFKTLFAGIGLGGLAGWLAYYALKEEGREVYMVGAGIGFDPRPADPLMSSSSNIATSRMLVDAVDIHGVCIGGVKKACLGILGAAQIDKQGNINSSRVSVTTYIGGAGGGNDIANGAKEVIVVTKQKKDRFLEKVPYVTCPGKECLHPDIEYGHF